jgi:pimeloyl-ACP methyl ester carboxylesterase
MHVLTGPWTAVEAGVTDARATVLNPTAPRHDFPNPGTRTRAERRYRPAVRPLASLLAPVARRLVYPAAATRVPAEPTMLHMDVDGTTLRGWEVNPGRDRALVYYGGNGEGLEWLVPELGQLLPDHTSYLIAYRGYGASEGTPSEPVLISDALAVFDRVAARHPAVAVDVVGRSLGSGVAIQVAVRRPVERLVLVTPFDSLVATAADLFPRLPVRHLLNERWDSAAVAHRIRARTLVVRAGRDAVVWPARTDRLVEVLPEDTEVLDLPNAEHATLHEDPAYWPAIADFLGA